MKTFVINGSEVKVENGNELFKNVVNLFDNKEVKEVEIKKETVREIIMSPYYTVKDRIAILLSDPRDDFETKMVTEKSDHSERLNAILAEKIAGIAFEKEVRQVSLSDLEEVMKSFGKDFIEKEKSPIKKSIIFGINFFQIKSEEEKKQKVSSKLLQFEEVVKKIVFEIIRNISDTTEKIYNESPQDYEPLELKINTFDSLKKEILDSADETDKLIEEMRENIKNLEAEGEKLKDTLDNSKKEQTPSYTINYTSSTSWVDDAIAIGTIAVGVAAVGGLAYLAYKYFNKYDDIELEFE